MKISSLQTQRAYSVRVAATTGAGIGVSSEILIRAHSPLNVRTYRQHYVTRMALGVERIYPRRGR